MKRLFQFVFLSLIIILVLYLVKFYNPAFSLVQKQDSFPKITHYSSKRDIQIELKESERAILKKINSLRANIGLSPLKLDKSAYLLAKQHSRLMRKHGRVDFDLPHSPPFEFRKISIGISDTCFYAIYADISISRILKQIESESNPLYYKDDITHIGVGVVHQMFPWQYWITIVYVKRIAFLDKFPISIPHTPSSNILGWELNTPYSNPVVKMITPKGKVKDLNIKKIGKKRYKTKVMFLERGKYIIEILAQGPYGLEIAHLMPVFVEIPREEAMISKKEAYSNKNEKDLEKAMFELINYSRAKYNKEPLLFSPPLSEVARIHSHNMAEFGKVVHDLPGCKDLSKRLKEANLKVLKQGENVASGSNIKEVHQKLMSSPGHRQTILDSDFTHVGIGIVREEDLLYITQDFASFIPEVEPSKGQNILLLELNQIADYKLRENVILSSIAQAHSDKMATLGQLLNGDRLSKKLDLHKVTFRKVSTLVITAPTIKQIIRQVKEKQRFPGSMKEIGVGLRQSNDGNLWVTIILKN